jgi:FdrA protein
LSEAVNATTARQGLDLMARDPDAKVIVLVSKPPSSKIADTLVQAARSVGKPVVVNFIGYATASRRVDNVFFATTFDETAELAIRLVDSPETSPRSLISGFAPGQRYLRGLLLGGTLQYEALLILQHYVPVVYSNAPLDKHNKLEDSLVSKAHTVIDLGEDEFTVGRLHPMMDNDLRIRRLEKEASDTEVAVLLDVVWATAPADRPAGSGDRPALSNAEGAGRRLESWRSSAAPMVTRRESRADQAAEDAGARTETSNDAAARYVGRLLQAIERASHPGGDPTMKPVDLQALKNPLAGINVGWSLLPTA